ncbi:cysteine--tRNA ligase [Candidatus Pacearchaeota archaeon CG10_big_fil_rev_8_21_14_0_10_31_24]|nr:MAG: cysteine--tRNA ligase [Candidatus Pacearchaeota archaeon CG10_big_fil_rev_8_21_14_0_10_31_24]
MKDLIFYNTLTRKKEKFIPIKKGEVGIYSCGPTVYWYQHIGNLRTYIFSDILKRILQYNGYKVKQIINITDVGHLTSDADSGEDKMEKAASKEGKNASEIAEYYFDIFHSDLKKLNISEPNKWTKATEYIKEQIELISKLEKKGFTYKTSDGIYFDSSKFKGYGKLANLENVKLLAGKRINLGEKKNKTDFALWKFSNPNEQRQQEWKSPWGIGFPGWHIECSAMSMKYLGETFDIHTGGQDHIPIHHTNEIAQSEASTGKKFVNYWMHGAFLVNQEGKKVSKSTGGLLTITELEEQGYKSEHYRYFCLLTHYKKPLIFNFDNLDSAKVAYEKTKRKIGDLRKLHYKGEDKTSEYSEMFLEAINDDLNISKAIQIFLKALEDINFDSIKKIKLLEKFDEVLGLGVSEMKELKLSLPKEVKSLIEQREKLRTEKKWAESDIIRNQIKDLGFLIEDKPEGIRVEKI